MTCNCLFHSDRSSFETTRRDLVRSKWIPRNVCHRLAMAVCSSCKRNDPLPGKAEIVSSAETLKQIIEDKMRSVCTKGLAEYISTCLQVCIEDGNSESESRLIMILLRALEGDFSLLQQVATSNDNAPIPSKQTGGQKVRMTKHQIECMQNKRKKKMMMNQVTLPMFPGNIRRLETQLDKGSIEEFERSNKCLLSFSREKNSKSFDNNVQRTYLNIWTNDSATYKSVQQVLVEKSKQVQRLQDTTWSAERDRRKQRAAMALQYQAINNSKKDIVDDIVFAKETLRVDHEKKVHYQIHSTKGKQNAVVLQGGHCLQCLKPFVSLKDQSVCSFHSGYAVSSKSSNSPATLVWTCCGQQTGTGVQREHMTSGCCTSPQHVWRTSYVKTVPHPKQSRKMKGNVLTAQKLTKLRDF